jgi:acetyltransferase-like isoleucine patch superfamily enzyme
MRLDRLGLRPRADIFERAMSESGRPLRARVRDFLRYLPVKIGYERGPRVMSDLRKRWVMLRHPHATIRFGEHTYLGPGFSLDMPHGGTFTTGPRVEFRRGFRAELGPGATVEIGADSRFTYYVLIQCSTTINIGERCMFGQSTIMLDGHHRYRDITQPMLDQGYEFQPLRIEDDATITTKCTILADVGKRAFVGANAVVTKPVPPYTVAVGSPARAIDYFGPLGEGPEELRRDPPPTAGP